MRGRVLTALLPLLLTAGLGLAEAPTESLIPQDRPGAASPAPGTPTPETSDPSTSASTSSAPAAAPSEPAAPPEAGPGASPAPAASRPRPRPTVAPAPAAPLQLLNSHPAPISSPLPPPRPAATRAAAAAQAPAAAAPAAKSSGARVGARGALCGDSAITGTVLATITSKVKGCGVAEPVSVEFVAGVRLNPPATIDCPTAAALKTWVNKGLQPAFAPRTVVELRIYGSYTCRTRNSKRGAKISEHGRGKAIDIGAFVMDNGQTWTVLDNYNKTIRKAQVAACGPFNTTLGPGSDGFHENHLHFDTAKYSYGPYCH